MAAESASLARNLDSPEYASMTLHVRTASDDPYTVLQSVRRELDGLDRDLPLSRVMTLAESVAFQAFTFDSNGAPVVLSPFSDAGVVFSAATSDVVPFASGLNTAEFYGSHVTSGPVPAVKASVNGHDCFANVVVVDSGIPANDVEVVVTDELTGRPVQGATVLLSNPATGAAIGATAATDTIRARGRRAGSNCRACSTASRAASSVFSSAGRLSQDWTAISRVCSRW